MDTLRYFTRSNGFGVFLAQMIGLIAILVGLFLNVPWWYWLCSFGVYFLTGCLGVTMTFHRFLSHHSFRMSKPLEYLFSLFGALGGTGSSVGWVNTHIHHHIHSDTDQDPHSPLHRGLRVLISSYAIKFDKWKVRRLLTDRFHRTLHDYYYAILLGWAGLLTLLGWEFVLFGFLIPVGFQVWFSNLSNYFNHASFGYRRYETGDNSHNNWWLNLITWGEGGGHNYHHRFPGRPKFGERWWEFDPTYWMIKLFGKVKA